MEGKPSSVESGVLSTGKPEILGSHNLVENVRSKRTLSTPLWGRVGAGERVGGRGRLVPWCQSQIPKGV